MSVNVIYSTQAISKGGRNRSVETVDGSFFSAVSVPREIGGDDAPGVNAEQLFASGYAACFHGTMKFITTQFAHLTVSDAASVTATVGVGPREQGGFGLQVDLRVALPDLDASSADELVRRTHEVCPYSNAIRDNVEVNVIVDAGAALIA
ncbi:MAG: Ohr family peroxiredoxin [Pseudomonadota bacterium]